MLDRSIPIEMEDGDGLLTNLYDDEGIETDYPPRAVIGVGQYVSGRDAGLWFTVDLEDADWQCTERLH